MDRAGPSRYWPDDRSEYPEYYIPQRTRGPAYLEEGFNRFQGRVPNLQPQQIIIDDSYRPRSRNSTYVDPLYYEETPVEYDPRTEGSVFDRIRFPDEIQQERPLNNYRSTSHTPEPRVRKRRRVSQRVRGSEREFETTQEWQRNESEIMRVVASDPHRSDHRSSKPVKIIKRKAIKAKNPNAPMSVSPTEAYAPHSVAISMTPSPRPESADSNARPISASNRSQTCSVTVLNENDESRDACISRNRVRDSHSHSRAGYSVDEEYARQMLPPAVDFTIFRDHEGSNPPPTFDPPGLQMHRLPHQFQPQQGVMQLPPDFDGSLLPQNMYMHMQTNGQMGGAYPSPAASQFDQSTFGGPAMIGQSNAFGRMDFPPMLQDMEQRDFATDNLFVTVPRHHSNNFHEISDFPPESLEYDSAEERQKHLSERARTLVAANKKKEERRDKDRREERKRSRSRSRERGRRLRSGSRSRERHRRRSRSKSRGSRGRERGRSRSRGRNHGRRSRSRSKADKVAVPVKNAKPTEKTERSTASTSVPALDAPKETKKSDLTEIQLIEVEQNEEFFDGLSSILSAPIERVCIPTQSGFELSIGFRGVPPFILHSKVYGESSKKLAEYKVYNQLMQQLVNVHLVPASLYIDFYSYKALPGMLIAKLTPLLPSILEDSLKEHLQETYGVSTFTDVSIAECQNHLRVIASTFWQTELPAFNKSISGMKKDILFAVMTTPVKNEGKEKKNEERKGSGDRDREREMKTNRNKEKDCKADKDKTKEREKRQASVKKEEKQTVKETSTAVSAYNSPMPTTEVAAAPPMNTSAEGSTCKEKKQTAAEERRKQDEKKRSTRRRHSRSRSPPPPREKRHGYTQSHKSNSFLRDATAILNAPLSSSLYNQPPTPLIHPVPLPSLFPPALPSTIAHSPPSLFQPNYVPLAGANFSLLPPPHHHSSTSNFYLPPPVPISSPSKPSPSVSTLPPGVSLDEYKSMHSSAAPTPSTRSEVDKSRQEAVKKEDPATAPSTQTSSAATNSSKSSGGLRLARTVPAGCTPSNFAYSYVPPADVSFRRKDNPTNEADLLFDEVFRSDSQTRRK